MPIERDLRGKRFFVTGATGFLGTALVERILRCIPEAEITVLVRPGRRADASARLAREVIKNDCFDRLRDELGDRFADEVARRVRAVAGDVGRDGLGLDDEGRAALAAADVVIHSAATVSFDAPLTQAVEINLLGPSRVAAAMAECGSAGHLVAVSTAYVASTHQGEAKEELLSENRFTLDVAWQDEVTAARRAARRPAGRVTQARQARGFRQEGPRRDGRRRRPPDRGARRRSCARSGCEPRARRGRHGAGAVSGLARRLPVHQGARREGARRAVGGHGAHHLRAAVHHRVGAVRADGRAGSAASAWRSRSSSPTPGACSGRVPRRARGHHRRHPRRHGGGRHPGRRRPGGPSRDGRGCIHVASGVRNPLRYGRLVELGQDFFQRNPLYDERGQPINVPEWSFPGRGRVQRQLKRADTVMTFGGTGAHCLADQGEAGAVGRPHRGPPRPGQACPRATSSSTAPTPRPTRAYRVDNLLELWDECDARRSRSLRVRPRRHRLGPLRLEIHLPSVLEHTRVRTKAGQVRGGQAARPPTPGDPLARPASGRVRPRAHARCPPTWSTPTPGWPAATSPPPQRARFVADLVRQGAGPAGARPARPRRLPPRLLPALRGRAGGAAARGLLGALPPPAADPLVPRRVRPGAGPPRRWVTGRC